MNGGTLQQVNPDYNSGEEFYWKCFTCGKPFKSTIHKFLLIFETKTLQPLCNECKLSGRYINYSIEHLISFLNGKYKNYIIDLISSVQNKNTITPLFITSCAYCGDVTSATLNTFKRRGNFVCKECSATNNLVISNGSLLDNFPEIEPYFADTNKYDISKTPYTSVSSKQNKVDLICPKCKTIHTKRIDAIERTGALCYACARTENNIKNGNSLRDRYPLVADMFDLGENKTELGLPIIAKEISVNTYEEGKKFRFKCLNSKDLKEHYFKSTLPNIVKASEKYHGCPICSGKRVLKGLNDFKTKNPTIAANWDYAKNTEKPEDVYYLSGKEYYFICEKGHPFKKDLLHLDRAIGTSTKGCPVCHGKKISKGETDLFSTRPELKET